VGAPSARLTWELRLVNGVRPPVGAGSFYPRGAAELAATVDRLLAEARPWPVPGGLRALVVPHAGYVFSGAVAAAGFATLQPQARALRVALLGPSHFTSLRGIAVSGADGWLTPLGTVPVDGGLRATAVTAGAVVDDKPHARDHALEVQLPFLQQRAGEELRVLPAAVGGPVDETAAVVEALSPDALIVVSTDLSHFHDHATARRLDRRTADAVVALDVGAIRDSDACGADALRTLLVHARRAGWRCAELELRTSADAHGAPGRVVGYGAFALTAP
jgi:AmmeMemoRadiSam system protein B